MKKNVRVQRLVPTYAMAVIAGLCVAIFGCGGVTATAGTVRVVKSFEADYPLTELAWHPNGKELAVGQSLHRKVTVWDVTTGKLLRTIDKEPGAVGALAYSPDGRTLAVGRAFNIGAGKAHLHLYDAATGKLLRAFIPPPPEPRHSNQAHAVAFSPDSRRLVVDSYVTSNAGVVYELETGQVVCTYVEDERNNPFNLTYSLAFNPDGSTFAVGRIDGTLELWSAWDCKQIKEVKKVDNVGINSLSFTSDGKYLASASYGAGQLVHQGKPRGSDPIQVRDVSTFEKVKGFYSVLYGAMRSLHYVHGNEVLLAGGGGKSIEIWDVESGRLIDTIQGFSDVAHVAPSPDGKHFATVSGDEIKIWEFVR
ncbi:MAG: WD40 repeat domain-containing protein [Gammaproteobacteria bacterium]|nr:WD40 repeat domain-containing protein [Gammaproteobacteria bacterium]